MNYPIYWAIRARLIYWSVHMKYSLIKKKLYRNGYDPNYTWNDFISAHCIPLFANVYAVRFMLYGFFSAMNWDVCVDFFLFFCSYIFLKLAFIAYAWLHLKS